MGAASRIEPSDIFSFKEVAHMKGAVTQVQKVETFQCLLEVGYTALSIGL